MRVQCNACKGEYDTVQADGMPYFHVCPGVAAVLVRNKDGSQSYVAPGSEGGRPALGERSFNRADHRDERPIVDPKTQAVHVRSEGAGVTPLAQPAPTMELSVSATEVA